MSPPPSYRYRPLASDGSTFRIVSIFPACTDDPIECEFLEIPTSAAPTYTALSYTWGDPTPTAFAWHHGAAIPTPKNLSDALIQLRDNSSVRTCWIDALCINQDDDVEKSGQIPLMRRIYLQARTTMIYLGEDEDGSELVPSLIARIEEAFMKTEAGKQFQAGQRQASYTQSMLHHLEYSKYGLPEDGDEAWSILRKLLCRPWFSRVWVIQEACLSPSATLVCGRWRMLFKRFLLFIYWARLLSLPIANAWERTENSFGEQKDAAIGMSLITLMIAIGAGQQTFKSWKCIDLLQRARIAVASRPHDYCYGILGLSNDSHELGSAIDYSVPPEVVFTNFARHFIRKNEGIQVLYSASHARNSSQIPSWVPDWSSRDCERITISPEPSGMVKRNYSCAAASSCTPHIQLHSVIQDVLIVRGLQFDKIDALGECRPNPRTVKYGQDSKLRARLTTSSRDWVDGGITSVKREDRLQSIGFELLVADCVAELHSLLVKRPEYYQSRGEKESTVIWKTLICDRASGSPGEAPPTYSKCYDAFILSKYAIDKSWQAPHPLEHKMENFKSLEDLGTHVDIFQGSAESWCWMKRRGGTQRGFVGQFDHRSQRGDIVFLPLGSAVPLTIRPKTHSESNVHELIGECYVHGIMKGEAFSLDDVVTEDIHLA